MKFLMEDLWSEGVFATSSPPLPELIMVSNTTISFSCVSGLQNFMLFFFKIYAVLQHIWINMEYIFDIHQNLTLSFTRILVLRVNRNVYLITLKSGKVLLNDLFLNA